MESAFSYEVETVIEAAEGEHVTVMPIAGLKSSRWDPCRTKAQYLEQCMAQNDFNPAECQPQLADLNKCCKKYQVKLFTNRKGSCQAAIVSVQQGDLYDLHRNPEEANWMKGSKGTLCATEGCAPYVHA